tara:strand:- start:43 stop:894 length:852 start_codon:yes stop_codon:yes gene_type:complete
MNMNNFAVFILTYGRPNKVDTFSTLKRQGYSGKIYLLCSEDDVTINEYKKIYGKQVIIFSKEDYKNTFDIGDNFDNDKVVVYARNANFVIAKKLGIEYFLQLDDDYTGFQYKIPTKRKLLARDVKDLDWLFKLFINFYKTAKIKSIAFAQGGDYIGGTANASNKSEGSKRKLMNCFFNCTNNPYQFYGRINEDVTCYVVNGGKGDLFLTQFNISARQGMTQQNNGGLTDFYLDTGTYYKSFYSVMMSPSNVTVAGMGWKNIRLHHRVSWNNAVPKILREKYKK